MIINYHLSFSKNILSQKLACLQLPLVGLEKYWQVEKDNYEDHIDLP